MSKKYHYVYYSYEEYGRGYIGSRSCSCLPQEDRNYFGSFTDKTFTPTNKIIIAEFNSRKEAFLAEINLHSFYDVVKNPHFVNKAKLTTSGFSREGITLSKKTREKISKAHLGKTYSEETRKKMSEARKGKPISENTKMAAKRTCEQRTGSKNPMYGRTLSSSHKKKISDKNKGKIVSESTRELFRSKKLAEQNPMYGKTAEKHHFYGKKHSEETKKLMREKNIGKGWFTDGVNNVRALECPEGYYKGRTIKPRGRFP
jgi:hypothetical protein